MLNWLFIVYFAWIIVHYVISYETRIFLNLGIIVQIINFGSIVMIILSIMCYYYLIEMVARLF